MCGTQWYVCRINLEDPDLYQGICRARQTTYGHKNLVTSDVDTNEVIKRKID